MTGSQLVLIDSSVWIETVRSEGHPAYIRHVDRLLAEGRAATCEVVIAEVLQGAGSEVALAALAAELGALVRLDMTNAGEAAGRLAWSLRRRGLTIPATDLLIAATARINNAALLHRDRHLTDAADVLGIHTVDVG